VTRNRYARLWIWIFLVPLAMDYKAVDASSSHVAQLLLAVPTLAAGAILALIAPRFQSSSRLRSFVTCALIVSVAGSFITQLLQGNDFGNYLRVLLPFGLFLLGYMAACHPWHEQRIEQIEKAIFWANVISLIFTFVYGMATVGGEGLANVRFRIASPTFLGLQGVLLHEFVIAKRFSPLTIAIFLGMVVIELLTVTRSLLVGTALLFMLATWMSAPSARHLVKALLRAAAVSVMIGTIAVGAASLIPGVAEQWATRIYASKKTESGKDPTTITRLAEIKDQYDQVTSSAGTLLIGEGYGHYYRYSPDYLPALAGQITDKDFYAIKEWGPGHNFWVYQLFAGGLLFGLGLPVALAYALYKCTAAYRRWRELAPRAPDLPVMGRAILLLAALPAQSIGGNPLGGRFCGVVFGVALGLMIAMHMQLQRSLGPHGRRGISPAPSTAARVPPVHAEPHFVGARDATAHSTTNDAIAWRIPPERALPSGSH
jgi:hypothetical protein